MVSHDEPFFRLRNQGLILAHAFQRQNGGLLANDLVEERDGKYFEIETGEEVNRIVSKNIYIYLKNSKYENRGKTHIFQQ